MSKKRIIMIAAAGLISFGGSFIVGWLTKTPPLNQPIAADATVAGQEAEPKPLQPAGIISTVGIDKGKMKRAMTEKQLKDLVYDLQEKMHEYKGKLRDLEVREQRLQIAHDTIKKDIEELNNLQIELASTTADLRNERDKLLKSRATITKTEKANLMSISATYDKMDAASAGKILTNISKMQNISGGSSLDDAVKILHYMTERTKAKLLAELVTSEPKLAAVLCQRLKQIIEEE